jgi:hypothetical protein
MARRTFLAQLAGLPFLALGTKAEDVKKPLKIMMKSAGGRRSDQGGVSLCARIGAGGSRAPGANISARGSDGDFAQVDGELDHAGGLAAAERNTCQSCCQEDSDLCLRSVFPDPWGHRNRFK